MPYDNTLTVGTGQQFQTIAAALAVANKLTGSVDIQITAGTYVNDGGFINHNQVTIEGVGGVVRLVGANPANNGVAALSLAGNGLNLENLDISGVAAGDGILVGSGALTLNNVAVHDNQEGVIFARDPTASLTIYRSEIYHNGAATGGANVDAGMIASLTIEYSKIHDAVGGPEIRSRAAQTMLYGNLVADNASSATTSIDLPTGGLLLLAGTTIEKGANSAPTSMITWDSAGMIQPNSSIIMNSNVLINDVFPNTDSLIDRSVANLSVSYTNQTWNLPDIGSAASSQTVTFAALPTRPILPLDASIFVETVPSITVVTGNRDGTVTISGRFVAGHPVTVADTVGGITTLIGSATTSGDGRWSVISQAKINLTTLNSYTVSGVNDNFSAVSMPGTLFLTDTGADHLTSAPGAANTFAIMSYKGSDIIDGFKTTVAAGLTHDLINFSGRNITNFAQVQAMMSGSASTIITMTSGKTITLDGVSPSTLSAANFVYS